MVRCIGTFIKANQIEREMKTVRYCGGSLYSVFDTAKFDFISKRPTDGDIRPQDTSKWGLSVKDVQQV